MMNLATKSGEACRDIAAMLLVRGDQGDPGRVFGLAATGVNAPDIGSFTRHIPGVGGDWPGKIRRFRPNETGDENDAEHQDLQPEGNHQRLEQRTPGNDQRNERDECGGIAQQNRVECDPGLLAGRPVQAGHGLRIAVAR